jgi:steroid delta-isomerase-like uncharacterized protein
MSESNKAVVRRYIEEIGNQSNLPAIDELFSADSIWHGPSFQELRGREARREHYTSLRGAFPDFHLNVDELIAEGDKVMLRWSMTGTHRGEFWGVAPTRKKVSPSGTSIFRIVDGMITEEFMQWDALGYMQQIGAVTDSAVAEANKAVVHRLCEEMLNQHNFALADELFSADSIAHGPSQPELRGREARKQHFVSLRRAFPDFHFTIEELIAEGIKVVLRWFFAGTHKGEFLGAAPTGKKVSCSGTSTFQIVGGMITEELIQWDALGFMQQIGVVPAISHSKDQDTAAIKSMLDSYAAAANGGNVAALVNYYTDDAIRMPPNEPAVAGREAVRSWMQSSLDQFIMKGFSFPRVEVEVAGDWAFARVTLTMTPTPKAGGEPIDYTGKAVAIYKRQADGSWRACCDIWNSDKPLPAPGK